MSASLLRYTEQAAVILIGHTREPALDEVGKYMVEAFGVAYNWLPNYASYKTLLQGYEHVLLICSPVGPQETADFIEFCNQERAHISSGKFRILTYTQKLPQPAEQALLKLGVLECLTPDLNSKTLKLKVELHSSLVLSAAQNQSLPATGHSNIQFTNPLQMRGDFWLFPENRLARFLFGHWTITMIGPPAALGHFIEAGSRHWVYKARAHDLQFQMDAGYQWHFYGDQAPLVNEVFYSFCGKEPRLEYTHESGQILQRFAVQAESRSVAIARNSTHALRLMPRIRKEMEKLYRDQPNRVIEFPEWVWPKDSPTPPKKNKKKTAKEEPVYQEAPSSPEQSDAESDQFKKLLQSQEKLFSTISTREERDEILRNAVTGGAPTIIWAKEEPGKINAELVEYKEMFQEIIFHIPNKVQLIQLETILANSSIEVLLLRVNLDWGVLFSMAQTSRLQLKGPNLVIPVPSKLFKVQRRKHFRYELSLDSKIYINTPKGQFKVINISAGGLLFEGDDQFTVGDKLGTSTVEVLKQSIESTLEFRWKKPLRRLGFFHYGVQFLDLTPERLDELDHVYLDAGYEEFLKTESS